MLSGRTRQVDSPSGQVIRDQASRLPTKSLKGNLCKFYSTSFYIVQVFKFFSSPTLYKQIAGEKMSNKGSHVNALMKNEFPNALAKTRQRVDF